MKTQAQRTEQANSFYGKTLDYAMLSSTLSGFRAMLAKRLSLDPGLIFWSFTADWRSTLNRKRKSGQQIPFIRFGISNVSIDYSRFNVKAASRSGIHVRDLQNERQEKGWLVQYSPVPVRIELNCYYVDSDAERALRAGLNLQTLIATNALNFNLSLDGVDTYTVKVGTDSPQFSAPSDDQFVDLDTDGAEETQAFSFTVYMTTLLLLKTQTPAVSSVTIDLEKLENG